MRDHTKPRRERSTYGESWPATVTRGGLTQNTKRKTQFHLEQNVRRPWVFKNPEGGPRVPNRVVRGFLAHMIAFQRPELSSCDPTHPKRAPFAATKKSELAE